MLNRPSTRPVPLPEKIASLLQEARWLLLGVLAAYLAIVLFGYAKSDPGWSHAVYVERVSNPGGRFGAWLSDELVFDHVQGRFLSSGATRRVGGEAAVAWRLVDALRIALDA
ncbi:MAG TPA: DNA translocase FtsK 4TM domain-containing protein, partial [Rhodocyclaceae bacterium]|nr:DNA translocase FtsK 4TM domain-containing protein [Rhodocyclaceae bacterium]